MKKSLLIVVVVTLISAFSSVFAQNPDMHGPPKALLIVREDIKPGMMGAHNKHSANYAKIFRTLGTPNHRIALVPVTGSENEVVYLTAGDSFKELEDIRNATDKKMSDMTGAMKAEGDRLDNEAPVLHAGMRDIFALHRTELDYGSPFDVRTMRYFSITTVRVKPGHEAQYIDYVQKIIDVARQKAKIDSLHVVGYQVISGAQNGTFIVFRLMKSLAELDEQLGMKMRAAMSDDMKKDADKTASDAIMSSETSTYSISPSMSYVEKDFAAGDPAFWNPKPPMMGKPKN